MREQLRQPRLAELVASRLREEILSGRLTDGDTLPRQEDLLARFQVGVPSIREAMRVLETEGLVSVRRGNVGGGAGARAAATVARAHLRATQAFTLSRGGNGDGVTAVVQAELVRGGGARSAPRPADEV